MTSVLKISRQLLQEYKLKIRGFHLKNLRWLPSDFEDLVQDPTVMRNALFNPATFLFNIFL